MLIHLRLFSEYIIFGLFIYLKGDTFSLCCLGFWSIFPCFMLLLNFDSNISVKGKAEAVLFGSWAATVALGNPEANGFYLKEPFLSCFTF